MPRQALTLIELVISIALSLIICYAAFSAFRLTSTTVDRTNRLALENRLLRTGIVQALDMVDHWTLYDSPWDPSNQPLRGTERSNPFRELQYDRDFGAHRPENWWRGRPWSIADERTGDYQSIASIGALTPEARVYPKRFKAINETLGHQALVAFLPANSIFQYIDENSQVPPAEFKDQNQTGESMLAETTGSTKTPWDIRYIYWGNALFPITTHQGLLNSNINRRYLRRDDSSPNWDLNTTEVINATAKHTLLAADSGPGDWPEVKVGIFNNSGVTITLRNPTTGYLTALQFNVGAATTLRGARQQRGLDSDL